MKQKGTGVRFFSVILSAAVLTTSFPMTALAAPMGQDEWQADFTQVGTIDGFQPLAYPFLPDETFHNRYNLTVARDTTLEQLELPDFLLASLTWQVEDRTESEEDVSTPSNASPRKQSKMQTDWQDIPVTWVSDTTFRSDEPGSFLLTPQLEQAYKLAKGVKLPQIQVQVMDPVATAFGRAAGDDVTTIQVEMSGRYFSTVASVGEAPYYQVFQFTVPSGGGGAYTFFTEYADPENAIDSYGYLCTEEQYAALCKEIETTTYCVKNPSGKCLIYNDDGGSGLNFYIHYPLEEGVTYYFVGTRYSSSYSGEYLLNFIRDITIDLDNQNAQNAGTEAIYSKGNLWYDNSDKNGTSLANIILPEKEDYMFGGYYTQKGGKGQQIIDETGIITSGVSDLELNTTLYAKWISLKPEEPVSQHQGSGGRVHTIWSVPEGYGGETKLIGMIRVPTYTVVGSWSLSEAGDWSFADESSVPYVDRWAALYNPYADLARGQQACDWFRFDADGKLMTGWYTEGDDTYYLNPSPDNTLGAMKTGWVEIEGDYYYFERTAQGQRGKMYRDSKTPDGYYVDKNGVWKENMAE